MRVVCNPYTNKMSYYIKNERDEWNVLSSSSPLSRQYYTDTTVKEKAVEILSVIDEVYNRKNKGVDILFEGTTDSYGIFNDAAKRNFANRDITCNLGTTKVAVIGKIASGKSTLIEGLEKKIGFSYNKIKEDGYEIYIDECNHAQWYELKGIDLGLENLENAFRSVSKLSKDGLSAVIYCISGTTGRIEKEEKEFIMKLDEAFSSIKVMVALTMCYRDDVQDIVDEIERITNQSKVTVTLAKEYKTGLKDSEGAPIVVDAFGIESVSEFIFEGR